MGIFRQFPYSNFHEMNLDWIINTVKQLDVEWERTKNEWASYKEFIDNYFENLDVSEEVLEALRIFASDGTLNQILDPTITSETARWLTQHITHPTTPVIDTSLSVAGAAADAKATGDAINELELDLFAYARREPVVIAPNNLKKQWFNVETGIYSPMDSRLFYAGGFALRGAVAVDVDITAGYKWNIYFANTLGQYTLIEQYSNKWVTVSKKFIRVPSGADRVYIACAKLDDSDFTDSEIYTVFNIALRGCEESEIVKYDYETDFVSKYGGTYQFFSGDLRQNYFNRITQDRFYEIDTLKLITITPNSGYRAVVNFFDSNFNGLGNNGFWIERKAHILLTQYPTAKYFKITVASANDSYIMTLADFNQFAVSYYSIKSMSNVFAKAELKYKESFDYNSGDIAVFNGNIFMAGGADGLFINGVSVTAQTGHGNNIMFGKELDGDFPRLYAGSWYKGQKSIYVNKVTLTTSELINTINFQDLPTGYMNMCVDEPNNRFYIFIETGEDTYQGNILFAVGDFEGNIISSRPIEVTIPLIQGTEFKNGYCYITSGNGTVEYPNRLHIFNTNGVLVYDALIEIDGEVEGMCITEDIVYVKSLKTIFTF